MPPLAAGFIPRAESAPSLGVVAPGTVTVLGPADSAGGEVRDWIGVSGKTQLAVHLAESLWSAQEVHLLVWVPATSRSSVIAGYVAAAAAATGADPAGAGEAAAARFVSWLRETSRRWLVILDDLPAALDLEGLWPAGAGGRVVVTTRSRGGLAPRTRATVWPVAVFSQREALGYLMERLSGDPDQRLGALDLVKELGCEPLALAQASAVIAGSTLSCRGYQEYFAQRRAQLTDASGNAPAAASVTWTLSFQQAAMLSPDGTAQSLLALVALMDGHGIPDTVLTAAAAREYIAADSDRETARPDQARDGLLLLAHAGLLDLDPPRADRLVRMSPVVQRAIRSVMPAEMLAPAARAVAAALVEVWPEDDTAGQAADRLRASVGSLRQAAGDLLWEGGCHPLLLRAGRSLDRAGLAAQAASYWRDLVAVASRLLGREHPDTLVIADRLARACLAAGRPAAAVPWSEWVLEARARTVGRDHPATLEARRHLGHAFMTAGQASEAIAVLDSAVADCERHRGLEHPDTVAARGELAAAYAAAGKPDVALQLRELNLKELEHARGGRHPDTMAARQELAAAYLASGRGKDAISQYKRALADRERVHGRDDLETISARSSLGSAYQAAGKVSSALQLQEQASGGYERALGASHPRTLGHRAKLAEAYYAAGRLTDAAALLRDTLARCEDALPEGDELTALVRDNLESLLHG